MHSVREDFVQHQPQGPSLSILAWAIAIGMGMWSAVLAVGSI